ncbi:MAG: MACPF domain-containing protein [Bacilli bacterium]|nr:MACPF domain-containing protein [Bacilli bacterium]
MSSAEMQEVTVDKKPAVKMAYEDLGDYQYIGYGYDVTSGPIYNTTSVLKINNPILDLKNTELLSHVTTLNSSSAKYVSDSSTSKRAIANSLGKTMTGGLDVGARIASVNVDIGAAFNTSATNSWGSVQQEEFSYHNIVATNKTVAIQNINDDQFYDYLSPSFKSDALGINSLSKANQFILKYGTHLLTSYTLGGVFEMTNYFASNSSEYIKEQTTSFDSQIDAGMSFMNANIQGTFSFSNTYGQVDNNSYATNQYKLTTYGGKVFPGLTMDQAFSYNPSVLDGKGGFMYRIWTDSINEGYNLCIVNTPSPMIPIYQLLPNNSLFQNANSLLLEAYLGLCNSKMAQYNENNKDVVASDMKEAEELVPSINVNGYDSFSPVGNKYFHSYIELPKTSDANTEITMRDGERISINYQASNCDEYGGKWVVTTGWSYINFIDERNGVFTLKNADKISNNQVLVIQYKLGDKVLYSLKIKYSENGFSGGEGTESSPYLISNTSELFTISSDAKYLSNNVYFKLIKDLDFAGVSFNNKIGAIKELEASNDSSYFNGTFDGNHHFISNINVDDNSTIKTAGIFGSIGSNGVVKNLTVSNYVFSKTNTFLKGEDNEYSKVLCNGVIAGYSAGTIENCHVRYSKIDYTISSKVSESYDGLNSKYVNRIGGIVGYLSGNGSITESTVTNSNIVLQDIQYQKSTDTDQYGSVASRIGGLVGDTDSTGTISRCEVSNTNSSRLKKARYKNSMSYVGGFIGRGTNSKIDNCMVEKCSVKLDNLDGAPAAWTGNQEWNVGGFIGLFDCAKNDSLFISNILSNVKDATISNYKDGTTGQFIAHFKDSVKNNISNAVSVKNSSSYLDFGKDQSINSWISGDYNSQVLSSDYWEGTGLNRKIKFTTIRNVEFNFDGAKTKFIVGEPFEVGYISAEIYLSTGGYPEEITSFEIDYSRFNNSIVGKYRIFVSTHGFDTYYEVNVVNPSATSIKVSKLPTKTDWVEGDSFVADGLEVIATLNNGESQTITSANPLLRVNAPKHLVAGQNKIFIEYEDVYTYIIVNAIEKKIEDYSIISAPSKLVYDEYETEIDLSGLVISVKLYGVDDRVIIKYEDAKEDFEVFHPKFKSGKNIIRVSYLDFIIRTFEINVNGNTASSLAEFINVVNYIEAIKDISEKYDSINYAVSLKTKLYEECKNDSSYISACEKLDRIISEFNTMVNNVNDDFNNVIVETSKISNGNIAVYVCSGLAAIAVVSLAVTILL